MTVSALPHGIYPYLVSPLDAQGRVKEAVLEQLCDDLIGAGVDGLTPLGSTGEIVYLTLEQRQAIVGATVRSAAGRVPVAPGVSAVSTFEAVGQAQAFERMGAAGLVVMRQNGSATTEEGALGYFEAVAQSVSVPIVLYTNPTLLGTDFTIEGLARLSQTPNIRYIKDATGDTGRILSLLNRLDGKLEVFSASAHIPALVFLLGGVGWMAGPACVIPRAAHELYRLVREGEILEALALQRRLWPVNEAFRRYPLGACIKAALAIRGYDVGDPLPPQKPLDAQAKQEIASALAEADAAVAP